MTRDEQSTPGMLEPDTLRAALAQADLRVLVMCLFHLTGDGKWLEAPYRPARDVRLIGDPSAGFDDNVQREIRETMAALLADRVPRPAVDDPGEALFERMMSICLGETVPAEYVPMMRQDMGFAERDVHWTRGRPEPLDLDVVIAGAGVSGLCLAAKLDALGVPFTVLEKPLSEVRLALMASSGHFVDGDDPNPFGCEKMTQEAAQQRVMDFLKAEPVLSEIPMDTPAARASRTFDRGSSR